MPRQNHASVGFAEAPSVQGHGPDCVGVARHRAVLAAVVAVEEHVAPPGNRRSEQLWCVGASACGSRFASPDRGISGCSITSTHWPPCRRAASVPSLRIEGACLRSRPEQWAFVDQAIPDFKVDLRPSWPSARTRTRFAAAPRGLGDRASVSWPWRRIEKGSLAALAIRADKPRAAFMLGQGPDGVPRSAAVRHPAGGADR